MKTLRKILLWISKIIAGLILLLLISGLCFRLFSSEPVPLGKLVDLNGTKLHIIAEGEKNDLPTLILEAGAGGTTDMFHWVAEGLKHKMRVIRYDREGKGFSETSNDSINSAYYAHQLHGLLEKNGEKPPYILVGHSMGGLYQRIYRDLYPNEVKGLVLIDASHPEQWKRLAQKDLIPEEHISSIKLGLILAEMGISGIFNKMSAPKFRNDGLPKECHIRSRNLNTYSGKVYKRYLKENSINHDILLRAGQTNNLDSLPLLVFSATEQYREVQKEKYRKQGIDPDKQVQIWLQMQKELKELSSNSKQFVMDANHGSIITKKENADTIIKEILLMVEGTK
ncbi:alpha/beta hydrolase [uncultured Tenacibaculum sp.]|uniref:alpha/beta fold hydrolase n=1 Tax=uncultured Tenacibaculum sp. TaxID=174713 RepID=UPI002619CAE5|nr:alpha/beta hydrolase [uncultured Tenacibaculum sp.]